MSRSKRDFFQMMAKEDTRRAKMNESSLTHEIMNSEKLTDFATILSKRIKGTTVHVRTTDAWARRAQSVKLNTLKESCELLITETPCEQKIQTENSPSVVSDVSEMKTFRSTAKSPQSVVNSVANSVAKSSLSVANSVAKSSCSVANSVAKSSCSVANSVAKSSHSVANSDINSAVGSSHSVPNSVAKSFHSDAHSIANSSHVNYESNNVPSVVSAHTNTLSTVDESATEESDINKWYEDSLLDLRAKSLRNEQYRRKKAMLRVEYWTKLDQLRNDATPTVIGFH